MKQTRKITNVLLGAGLILLLCLVFLTSRAAQDCPPCIPAPFGLVSWWPGDGSADDIWDGNDGDSFLVQSLGKTEGVISADRDNGVNIEAFKVIQDTGRKIFNLFALFVLPF